MCLHGLPWDPALPGHMAEVLMPVLTGAQKRKSLLPRLYLWQVNRRPGQGKRILVLGKFKFVSQIKKAKILKITKKIFVFFHHMALVSLRILYENFFNLSYWSSVHCKSEAFCNLGGFLFAHKFRQFIYTYIFLS